MGSQLPGSSTAITPSHLPVETISPWQMTSDPSFQSCGYKWMLPWGCVGLVSTSSEPCPLLSISFSLWSDWFPSPPGHSGTQNTDPQRCIGSPWCWGSTAILLSPADTGRSTALCSKTAASLRMKGRQPRGLPKRGRGSSCCRKTSDSLLWKLEG